ncbi:MAG: hypothetical protein Q9168_003907 [Polycauliona sp. 1 TL-2023]
MNGQAHYCSDCNRWFTNDQAYAAHMANSSQHNIRCIACDRDFVSIDSRRHHWEDSDIHLYSYCDDCEWDFVDEDGLKRHFHSKHRERYCKKCDRTFEAEAGCIAHSAAKHKSSYCTECKYDNIDAADLRDHIRRNHSERYCEICYLTFDTKAARDHHTVSAHRNSYCFDCHVAFKTSDALKQHWQTHQAHVGTYDYICDLKFPTKATRTEHLNTDPAKHFVCVKHQQFCGSNEALQAHYLKAQAKGDACKPGSDKENHRGDDCQDNRPRCLACKLFFKDIAQQNAHYMTSDCHVQCHPCKLGFETEQHRGQHYLAQHVRCLRCQIGFEDNAQLNLHYRSSALHVTCMACGVGFPDEKERQDHYWAYHTTRCSSCRLGFEDMAQLQEHYMDPVLHVQCDQCKKGFEDESKRNDHDSSHHPSRCPTCGLRFGDDIQLQEHRSTAYLHFRCDECAQAFDTSAALSEHEKTAHRPEQHVETPHTPQPLHCFANCDNDATFPSIAAVLEHLEDGTCFKGWTIQHLNALIVQTPSASPFIVWPRVAYFLAGAPRHHPHRNDHTDRGWKCYLCKASLLSSADLQRHWEAQECHTPYPDVLRCTLCRPDQIPQFRKLSELVRHLTETEGGNHDRLARQIGQEVREKMSLEHEGRPEEMRVLHQLRIDASSKGPRKELIVKVSMMG